MVAIAPVPDASTLRSEPVVTADVPFETMIPTPVVSEVPTTFTIVPAVVEFAFTSTNPPSIAEVLVKAPVAVSEIAPLVASAPAVEVVARKSEPDVRPVVDTNDTKIPVVAAPAVTRIIPVPVYAPVVVQVR